MIDGYTTVNASDLSVGDVVIVEQKHFDYKTGRPVESEFFRAIVGEHSTVSGRMKHLVSEPTLEWPSIPQWQGLWTYAGNNAVTQMWRRKSDGSD